MNYALGGFFISKNTFIFSKLDDGQ